MRLTVGTRVGPYEVLALLGAGGMAEVYRARDTRLGREVALKVVSEALGGDGAFVERFEREAKLAGSLNHPNVIALHDVGLHDGKPYFVTELLQGETLRERLTEGPIAVGKTLEWGAQMAQGLAAAQERGIVHRDLKPENVFLTKDGHVKLLDFGIAKLIEAAHVVTPHGLLDETVSPSGSSTGTGMVLGTPGYMSPEQVRGDTVDARTDFFSLGAVLYEMLSGRRAFSAGSVVESGYAILHNEPEPLPTSVPVPVAQVVHRCLEKEPGRRFQSARDLAFNLELLRTPTGSITSRTRPLPTRRGRRFLWGAVAVAAASALAAAFYVGAHVRRDSVSSVRQLTFREGRVSASRFAPDSRAVYFSASWNGEPEQVYSTTTDNPDYHPLGISDARIQSVSASGELAVLLHLRPGRAPFGANGTLARVPGVGGVPREIADDVSSADWAPDAVGMVITRETAQGSRVEYPIGNSIYETSHPLGGVRLSPKGGRIAFVEFAVRGDLRGDIVVIEPGRPKHVLIQNWEGISGIAWSPEGDALMFAGLPLGLGQQTSLWSLSLAGEVRLLRAGAEPFLDDVSREGRALVREQRFSSDVAVVSLAQGKVNARLGWYDGPQLAAISEDGRTLLVREGLSAGTAFGASYGGGSSWVFLQQTDGSAPVRLGAGNPLDLSRDGKWALAVDEGHPGRISLLPTGSGTSRSFDFPDFAFVPRGAFLLDANHAALAVRRPEGVQMYVFDLEKGRERPVSPPGGTGTFRISPDRRFLAAPSADGTLTAYPTEEGPPRALPGVEQNDLLVGWTDRGLLVVPDGKSNPLLKPPVSVVRVDITTGARGPFTVLAPGDAAHADVIFSIRSTADEQTMAYSYFRLRSTLYLFGFGTNASESAHGR